jgi:hypothetical protein
VIPFANIVCYRYFFNFFLSDNVLLVLAHQNMLSTARCQGSRAVPGGGEGGGHPRVENILLCIIHITIHNRYLGIVREDSVSRIAVLVFQLHHNIALIDG